MSSNQKLTPLQAVSMLQKMKYELINKKVSAYSSLPEIESIESEYDLKSKLNELLEEQLIGSTLLYKGKEYKVRRLNIQIYDIEGDEEFRNDKIDKYRKEVTQKYEDVLYGIMIDGLNEENATKMREIIS